MMRDGRLYSGAKVAEKRRKCPRCGVKEALFILAKSDVVHFSGFSIQEVIQLVVNLNDKHN